MIKIVLGFYFEVGAKIFGIKRQDFMTQDLTEIKNVPTLNYLPLHMKRMDLV